MLTRKLVQTLGVFGRAVRRGTRIRGSLGPDCLPIRLRNRTCGQQAIAVAILLAASHFCSSRALAAEHYALLVGVTRYDNLAPSVQLQGPANDVELLAGILPRLGFPKSNIRILAEAPIGSERPTRAAILRELDRLAQIVQKDDYVYIHFSGHGARQPLASTLLPGVAESGGFQDIFLPADVGRWRGGPQAVANAITSRDMGAAIRKIRGRGPFVWATFDSCHSGAMVRSIPAKDMIERQRQVDPVDLGVPIAELSRALLGSARNGAATVLPAAPPVQDLDAGAGGFVGFFAAQSDEATVEMKLPAGVPDAKVQGLFTYTLVQAMIAKPRATYRSLGESILQTYASLNRLFPTPAFEGSALDSRVLGTEVGNNYRQWLLIRDGKRFRIEAGALNQLSKGSVLAVLPDPDATDAQVIGYLEITDIALIHSEVAPIAYQGAPPLDDDKFTPQTVVRLAHSKWGSHVRIALPPPPLPSVNSASTEVHRLITNLAQNHEVWNGGVEPQWVDPKEPADIRLMIEVASENDTTLWLLPASGEIVRTGPMRTPGILLGQVNEQLGALVVARIRQAVRTLTMKQVLQQIASRQPQPLIGLEVSQRRRNAVNRISAGTIPSVRDGDEIVFTATNRATDAVDITMLYIDSNDRVSVLYPTVSGGPNRVGQGGHHSVRVRVSAQTTGLEHFVTIAMAARPLAPRADFSFLADDRQLEARGSESEATGVLSIFRQAGFGVPTSRDLPSDISDRVDASMFSLRIEASK